MQTLSLLFLKVCKLILCKFLTITTIQTQIEIMITLSISVFLFSFLSLFSTPLSPSPYLSPLPSLSQSPPCFPSSVLSFSDPSTLSSCFHFYLSYPFSHSSRLPLSNCLAISPLNRTWLPSCAFISRDIWQRDNLT